MLPHELIRQVVKHVGNAAIYTSHWGSDADAGLGLYRKRASVIATLGRIGRAWKNVVDDELRSTLLWMRWSRLDHS